MIKLKLATLTFQRDIGVVVEAEICLKWKLLSEFLRYLQLWQFYSYDKIKFSNVNILKRHWSSCLSWNLLKMKVTKWVFKIFATLAILFLW